MELDCRRRDETGKVKSTGVTRVAKRRGQTIDKRGCATEGSLARSFSSLSFSMYVPYTCALTDFYTYIQPISATCVPLGQAGLTDRNSLRYRAPITWFERMYKPRFSTQPTHDSTHASIYTVSLSLLESCGQNAQ